MSGVVYWLSKDPIGISGGLNLYEAFGNSPTYYIDPFGLDLVRGNTADPRAYGHHQKVAAGDYGQSFGIAGGRGSGSASGKQDKIGPNSKNKGDGHVYEDKDPFTKILERMKTTPEEDKYLANEMRKEKDNRGNYNVFSNSCIHYSKDLFNRMKNLLEERRKNCAE